MEPLGLGWTGLDWTGPDWTGLDWTGLDWTGLDWTGLDWTGLDWAGLDRTGLAISFSRLLIPTPPPFLKQSWAAGDAIRSSVGNSPTFGAYLII